MGKAGKFVRTTYHHDAKGHYGPEEELPTPSQYIALGLSEKF